MDREKKASGSAGSKVGRSGNVAVIIALMVATVMGGTVGMLNMMTVQRARSVDRMGYVGREANSSAVELLGQFLAQRALYPVSYVPLQTCTAPQDCLYETQTGAWGASMPETDWHWNRSSQRFTLNVCDVNQLTETDLSNIYQPHPTLPDPTIPNCPLLPATTVDLKSLRSKISPLGYQYYEAIFDATTIVAHQTGDPRPEVARTTARLALQPPPPPSVPANGFYISNVTPAVAFTPLYTTFDNTVDHQVTFTAKVHGIADKMNFYTGNGPGRQDNVALTGCTQITSECSISFTVDFPAGFYPSSSPYTYAIFPYQNWPGGQSAGYGWAQVVVTGNVNGGPPTLDPQCNLNFSSAWGESALRPDRTVNLNWSVSFNDSAQTTGVITWNGNPLPGGTGNIAGSGGTITLGLDPLVTPSNVSYNAPGPTANVYTMDITDASNGKHAHCSSSALNVVAPQTCCRTFCNFNGQGSVYAHVFIPCVYAGACTNPTDPLCSNPGAAQQFYGYTTDMPQFVAMADGLRYQVFSTGRTVYNTTSPPVDDCNIYNYASPLIVDLDGHGIRVSGQRTDAILFDIKGEGRKRLVAWPNNPRNAFLVLDLNHNGEIDSGRELFGNATVGPKGERFSNGFQALAVYDRNHDGVIDARDEIYSRLRLWTDLNRNGKVDPGELMTLARGGVSSIHLKYRTTDDKDGAGNLMNIQSEVSMSDGSRHKIVDVILNDYFEKDVVDKFEESYTRAEFSRASQIVQQAARLNAKP